MRSTMFALGCAAVVLTACGEFTFAPILDPNNGGTGSHSLQVFADIESENLLSGQTTFFTVRVRDMYGDRVSSARVTITNNELGAMQLTETSAGTGDYITSRTAFPSGEFRLEVERGSDYVRNVVLRSPGLHRVTSPTQNETLAASQSFSVRWTQPARADWAEVETRDHLSVDMADNGRYTVPAAENPSRNNQRIRVWRGNEIDIAGGLQGSRLRVRVRNGVEGIRVQ